MKAFDEIYGLYDRRLFAFCLKYTKSKENAEEIMEDTFVHKLLTTEKPINIIQDKNYQSDFDRLMAETAETKYPN